MTHQISQSPNDTFTHQGVVYQIVTKDAIPRVLTPDGFYLVILSGYLSDLKDIALDDTNIPTLRYSPELIKLLIQTDTVHTRCNVTVDEMITALGRTEPAPQWCSSKICLKLDKVVPGRKFFIAEEHGMIEPDEEVVYLDTLVIMD